MSRVYEVALGKSFSKPRGRLVAEENIRLWISKQDGPCGMSVFCYPDQDVEEMLKTGPAAWRNQSGCPWVPIDIDKGDNDDRHTLHTAASVIYHLEELGLRPENYKIYFSGRGYHIMIHQDCFSFPETHNDWPYMVKATMIKLFASIQATDICDTAVYMRTSLIRCPFTINPKSGLYKIPLTRDELVSEDVELVHSLAQTPRWEFEWLPEYYGDGELREYLVTNVPPVPQYREIRDNTNFNSCLQKLFGQGPIKGTRNNTVLVLASELMKIMPLEQARLFFDRVWNDPRIYNKNSGVVPLDSGILQEKIEQVYDKHYQYSCKNPLKKKHCSTRCVNYSNKNRITGSAPTFEEVLRLAKERDFLKELQEGINIGKQLGTTDFVVTRGEIVTFIGITKGAKSTFIKNLTLGIDFVNNKLLDPMYLRRTLYYTAEQASEYFLVTCCRILEDCDKVTALKKKDVLLDKWEHRLSHIMPIDQMPMVSGLRQHIQEYSPEVVVIDTIDHMVDSSNNNEHLGIKAMMLELQKISAETGVIFYIVSQVKRQSAIDNAVDLFSGKGSGSIENQSRKVIGLSKAKEEDVRTLQFLADSYGKLPDNTINLRLTDSLRLLKE